MNKKLTLFFLTFSFFGNNKACSQLEHAIFNAPATIKKHLWTDRSNLSRCVISLLGYGALSLFCKKFFLNEKGTLRYTEGRMNGKNPEDKKGFLETAKAPFDVIRIISKIFLVTFT